MSNKEIIEKIDIVIKKFDEEFPNFRNLDLNYHRSSILQQGLQLYPMMCETIRRSIPPGDSFFASTTTRILKECTPTEASSLRSTLPQLRSILLSLKNGYENELFIDIAAIYHAEIFDDFLEMGEYLLSEGYKDAAAVIIGGVLEDHLKKLCIKNSIPITKSDSSPISMGQLNNDLYSNNLITRGDNKNLIAWIEIRNNAAHADYAKYNEENVKIMLQGIREFITRHPA